MDIIQTVKEVFEPTFEAIGDGELPYDKKRALLYNLYCFACAVYPGYVAAPSETLFEYGCCFLIEPERHPDYSPDKPEFTAPAPADDCFPGGGRRYSRRGKQFIKYDFGSPLFDRMLTTGLIPPQDREPIPSVSLYAAVYLACSMYKSLRPLWFTYYFYLDATNEPVDEEFDGKLWELLRNDEVYGEALSVAGSMLIGDETELDVGKLADFYGPFIKYRRGHIFDVFEKFMAANSPDYVAEYSGELLKYYPESVNLMNWNAASRTECIARDHDAKALDGLIADLREYVKADGATPAVKKYLKLATLMKKNIEGAE